MNQQLSEKIQELQISERNLQGLSMERQTLQVELNEINNALFELSSSGDEVYKIISGLMVKAEKASVSKNLEERKKVLELRISSIEKQEGIAESKAESLRNEINANFESGKK